MNKLVTVLVLSILLFVPVSFNAQTDCKPDKHAKLPYILDLTYHDARPKMLARGWRPFQTISNKEASTYPDTSIGNGKLFWQRGYREIEACAGTGTAPCAFLYEDSYSNRLIVTTAGEEWPEEKVFARVTGYSFVCNKNVEH